MVTYEAATPEEVDLVMAGIAIGQGPPTGFAYNARWIPPVMRVVGEDVPGPEWPGLFAPIDERLDALEAGGGGGEITALDGRIDILETALPTKADTSRIAVSIDVAGELVPAKVESAYALAGGPTVPEWANINPGGPGADGESLMQGLTGPRWAGDVVNVMAQGAAGDGTTDDYADITAAAAKAITTGRDLYFPGGVFAISQRLIPPTGARWRMSIGTVITYTPGSPATFELIDCRSSDIRIEARGARLIGTWDNATYIRSDVALGGRILAQSLLRISADYIGSGETMSHVVVDGLGLERAGHRAVFLGTLANRTLRSVHLKNMWAEQCREGIYITGGSRSATAGWMDDITVDGFDIDDTWGPATAWPKNSTLGGNAVTAVSVVDDLVMERLNVKQCGRMTIEATNPSLDSYAAVPRNLVIRDSYLGPALYRTLSTLSDGQRITGCTIYEANDFLELSGRNLVFERNTIYNAGIETYGAVGSTQLRKDVQCRNWVVTANTFVDPFSGVFKTSNNEGVSFTHNTILITQARPANGVVANAIFTVTSAYRVDVTDNTVQVIHSVWEYTIANLSQNYECAFDRNTVELDARVTSVDPYGAAAVADFVPYTIARLVNCSVSRNTLSVKNALTIGYAISWAWGDDVGIVTRRVFTSSTAYTDTASVVTSVSLVTPPGAPATNAIYLVGDAPTGAWASNPVSFATWDGAIWTFQSILNIFADRAHLPGGDAYPDCPTKATTGDVYAMVRNAAVGNRIEGNTLDGGKKLTVTFDPFTMNSTNGRIVSWRNEWIANNFVPQDRSNTKCAIFGDAIIGRHGEAALYINPAILPPACAANRGKTRRTIAAAGTADQVAICTKDAANACGWRSMIP